MSKPSQRIMTKDAQLLIMAMLRELQYCGHRYDSILQGCFDYCMKTYNLATPEEERSLIISKVIEILNEAEV